MLFLSVEGDNQKTFINARVLIVLCMVRVSNTHNQGVGVEVFYPTTFLLHFWSSCAA
jgi:hypothetical protein